MKELLWKHVQELHNNFHAVEKGTNALVKDHVITHKEADNRLFLYTVALTRSIAKKYGITAYELFNAWCMDWQFESLTFKDFIDGACELDDPSKNLVLESLTNQ